MLVVATVVTTVVAKVADEVAGKGIITTLS